MKTSMLDFRQTTALGAALGASLLALSACTPSDMGGSGAGTSSSTTTPADFKTGEDLTGGDPSYQLSRQQILDLYGEASCDALSGVTGQISSLYNRGLRGVITTPTSSYNPNSYNTLDSFLGARGETLANKIYFSQVNVPTRAFSAGFPTLNGTLIKGNNDQTLVEWFRIDLDGYVELLPGMEEGEYEFALLADDGAEMKLGPSERVVISHQGVTATKMMCSTESAILRKNETLPLKLSYFQGPRYHIALVLLWRKVEASADPMCGHSGNDLFFNSNVSPSAPKQAYNDLLARGWSVVPHEALRIPDDEILNPCQSEHVRDIFNECTVETCGGIGI